MRFKGTAGVSGLLLLLSACAHGPVPEWREAVPEVGLASYYGTKAGERTASGEPYDPGALTCAHRTAPFGARLLVTELRTGRSVVVTVNDRGPLVAGRVVDLSLAAARRIGLVDKGVTRVRVERVR